VLSRARGGLGTQRLLRALDADRDQTRGLRRLLRRLEDEGRVVRGEGTWRVPRADGLVEGSFLAAERGRGGTVRDDTGRTHRVRDAGGAKSGDRVLVAPGEGHGAQLLHVVSGHRDRWVGILQRHGKLFGVAPYRDDGDWWIRVAKSDTGGAREGEVVAAVPVEHGRDRPKGKQKTKEKRGGKGRRGGRGDGPDPPRPWARVVERFGRPGEPEADFAAVVWRHRLPVGFPEEVTAQADAIGSTDPDEIARRVDLRGRPFVTIDPATARDHDDAVCVEPLDDGAGWRLWVAIADVGHHVPRGSPIDAEALRRGNSVYFPDRAIPMLPERLSGDICSLRPDVDRLVMAVELRVDRTGRITRRGFQPGVIRSRAKLSYEQAAAAIEEGDDTVTEAAMLRELGHLADALGRRRRREGSLDFEIPQPAFVLDESGHPVDVRRAPRTAAHRAIEEAMLAANRAVAELLDECDVLAVHRIHEPPAPADMQALVTELTALGLLEGGAPDALGPRELGRALERAVGRPVERYVHQLALRSMRRARYAPQSQPHFALAFTHYLHFTSPIRRYADLVVHRALKAWLAARELAVSEAFAAVAAVRASFRERLAMAAEREMDQIKSCVFLRDHLGEEHDGTVTGVARHGLYVTLDPWAVEGLVHVSRLPGYFEIDDAGRALESRGKRYELGDRLRILVADADPVTSRIDFELIEG